MPWCTSFSLVCTILSFHYFLRSFTMTWIGSSFFFFLWFKKCLGLLLGLEPFCYHTNNEWSSWQLIMLGWSDALRKFGVCEEAWGFGFQTPISSLCNLLCWFLSLFSPYSCCFSWISHHNSLLELQSSF